MASGGFGGGGGAGFGGGGGRGGGGFGAGGDAGIPPPPPPNFNEKRLCAAATGNGIASSDASRAKAVAAIQFGMMSGEDMMRASTVQIVSRDMYKTGTRTPSPFGCLDLRLGVSNKSDTCATCARKLQDCAGHFGYLKLELPVFHIGFLRPTIDLLQCICKSCSRVLLGPDERRSFERSIRAPGTDALRRARLRKRVNEDCRKVSVCPHCSGLNGQVKKVTGAQTFKIVHHRHKDGHKRDVVGHADAAFRSGFDDAVALTRELGHHVKRAMEDLNPLRVRDLFARMVDEDLDLVWADRQYGRPEAMILTHIFVPPVAIRPSVQMDGGGGSNEDDLTIKLQEIISMNNTLRLALTKGASTRMLMENWDFLQVNVAGLYNGELPGLPLAIKGKKPIRGLSQRLKGKQGRFRGNLSGKRVDFSARTVISPDPNLPLFCVGIPQLVAKDMTYPERVTAINIRALQRLVENGPDLHPGANYIRQANGLAKNLRFGDRMKAAKSLQIGDVVERHMMDGDAVLFNRQPSLHKMSIMCHRARVMRWRTFRFNECVCTPYNADFDGDEMNVHLPQTEEARSEAATLMDVRENLITPRSGEPLVAATQDFLTAAYLLTRRDTFLTRDELCQAVATLGDAAEEVVLPPPAVMKPVQLWTGKQVFNLLLRPNPSVRLHCTFETKARNNSVNSYHDPDDGYVIFRDGALMCGNLDKGTLGGGSKKGLVFMLCRDVHPSTAARALHRLTKMTSRWLMNWGFSIGIEDVAPAPLLSAKKEETLARGYAACQTSIAAFKAGTLQLLPGCNEEQSLESVLNGILSKLRDELGNLCMRELSQHNPPKIMATCGSKGSTINIAQMVACVGQQSVGGSRIQEGFVDRTLPAFGSKAKDPAAKGFVANSFFSGLTATEFFMHTMGGREGLVDTAVKTAETGYMQRRMMKALEDLSIQYDGTVRTSGGDVVQFTYGDDGLDPAYMEGNGRPADLGRLYAHAGAAVQDGETVPPRRAAALVPRTDPAFLVGLAPFPGTPAATAGAAGGGGTGSTQPQLAWSTSAAPTAVPAAAAAGGWERTLSPAEVMALVEGALKGPMFSRQLGLRGHAPPPAAGSEAAAAIVGAAPSDDDKPAALPLATLASAVAAAEAEHAVLQSAYPSSGAGAFGGPARLAMTAVPASACSKALAWLQSVKARHADPSADLDSGPGAGAVVATKPSAAVASSSSSSSASAAAGAGAAGGAASPATPSASSASAPQLPPHIVKFLLEVRSFFADEVAGAVEKRTADVGFTQGSVRDALGGALQRQQAAAAATSAAAGAGAGAPRRRRASSAGERAASSASAAAGAGAGVPLVLPPNLAAHPAALAVIGSAAEPALEPLDDGGGAAGGRSGAARGSARAASGPVSVSSASSSFSSSLPASSACWVSFDPLALEAQPALLTRLHGLSRGVLRQEGADAAAAAMDAEGLTEEVEEEGAGAASLRAPTGPLKPDAALATALARRHPLAWLHEGAAVVAKTVPVTRSTVLKALEAALAKYRRAVSQPGEAVGAVAAHSLGEPATQMTLKTFHFAGVASMNVTLGVPRIKELMNASRAISTPIIECFLENKHSDKAARVVKARLEKTSLGDVSIHILEVYQGGGARLEVKLDTAAIAALHLSDAVTPSTVVASICRSAKLRLKPENLSAEGADTVIVIPPRRQAASRQRAARQRAKERAKAEEQALMEGRGQEKGGSGLQPAGGDYAEDADDADDLADADARMLDAEEAEDEEAGAGAAAAAAARRGGGRRGGGAAAAAEEEDGEDDEDDEEDDDDGAGSQDFFNGGAAGSGSGGGGNNYLRSMADTEREDTYYGLQALKAALPGVLVQGNPLVNRAVITEMDREDEKNRLAVLPKSFDWLTAPKPADGGAAGAGAANGGAASPAAGAKKFKMLVEGYDLLRVMGTPGVNARRTRSNHVIEVLETLGVEAARVMIMVELAKTYGSYGIGIDSRHLQLLADTMTYRGEVLGVTRFGIAKMKDSVLMLASFEKTPDHLFDAALHARRDPCRGVSESIIIGSPIPLGTGLFKLMQHHSSTAPPRAGAHGGARGAHAQQQQQQAAASAGDAGARRIRSLSVSSMASDGSSASTSRGHEEAAGPGPFTAEDVAAQAALAAMTQGHLLRY